MKTQKKGRQAGAKKIEVTNEQVIKATRALEARLAGADYAVGEEDVISVVRALGGRVVATKNAQ